VEYDGTTTGIMLRNFSLCKVVELLPAPGEEPRFAYSSDPLSCINPYINRSQFTQGHEPRALRCGMGRGLKR